MGTRTDRTGRTHQLRAFRFDAAVCGACPLKERCVGPGKGSGRTVRLHPQEAMLQRARALQKSEGYAEYRQRRVVVEHRLARLVQLGVRQARYFGRTKTLFQLLMAATVANLTLVAGKVGRMGGIYSGITSRPADCSLAVISTARWSAISGRAEWVVDPDYFGTTTLIAPSPKGVFVRPSKDSCLSWRSACSLIAPRCIALLLADCHLAAYSATGVPSSAWRRTNVTCSAVHSSFFLRQSSSSSNMDHWS